MPGTSHQERLERAHQSIDGLSVGDAFGVFHGGSRLRTLMSGPWGYTDDTNMALSIYSILRQYEEIEQDALAGSFADYYDRERGYGPAMHRLLRAIREGGDWRELAPSLFSGQGSFGNGSAMRVAPVGAYFADDLEMAATQAHRAAEVTHQHLEGIAGAIAVAVAAAVAHKLRGNNLPGRAVFIDLILPLIPESEVRDGVLRARNLVPGTSVQSAAEVIGNGSRITCQDTVPFVLWCAGDYLYDYEEALWACSSAGGDSDTTCAMVGGIVVMYAGHKSIPSEWLERREVLPNWPFVSNKQ
ncbi:MAG: ADP-ribosylglycohydrolase family protein [Anaerolineae bacterium]|nr:ADP-ribosylglycohydrolase family protein [Anaerolineae bacterium]